MGNGIGREIGQTFESIGQSIEGSVVGAFDTVKGVVTGDFDYSSAAREFEDSAISMKNAYYGTTNPLKANPADVAKAAKARITADFNPQNAVNKLNWESVSNTVRNAHYGQATGIGQVTPPSQLMAISDPASKIAASSLRGSDKSMLKTQNNMADAKMVNNFIPNKTTMSNDTNSAGGTAPSSSLDQNQNQYPNT